MMLRLRSMHRDERGFALVTAVLLLSVMTMLMAVSLSAGQSAFTISERGARWNRTLVIAEAGVHDAVTRLGQDRTKISPCPLGTSTSPCSVQGGGQYQVDWTFGSNGHVTVRSVGYYPTMANAQITREVRVHLDPRPAFEYALFSAEAIELKNDQEIVGDIWGTTGVRLQNSSIVCGSITNAAGNVTLGNASAVVKSHTTMSGRSCTGKSGDVWTGGNISSNNGTIEGNARTGAPSGTLCSATSTSFQITGGTVEGNATACGQISGATVLGTSSPGVYTARPPVSPLPTYTFDPLNYPGLQCIPSAPTCGPTNTSTTAVATFNSTVRTPTMQGSYAIWQTSPTSATKLDLKDLDLSGDLTIVTNAPIELGNTGTISSPIPATLVLITLYVPPVGTSCSATGGDCSIYGKNSVIFDSGDLANPADGVVGVMYTPGKIAFKNADNAAEGALYGGSMEIKNGFEIAYNSRVERIVGFNDSLEQTLWQELAV